MRGYDTETSMPQWGAMCVQRFDDSQFCNSHYVSHFAAFFIVVRAKISVAESYNFITKSIMWQFLAHSQVWLERGGFGWFVGCYIGLEYRSHRFVGCWIVDRVEMILPQVHLRNGECFNCGWGILCITSKDALLCVRGTPSSRLSEGGFISPSSSRVALLSQGSD